MTTTNYVPTEEDIESSTTGAKSYRIANGKVIYGKEGEAGYEELTQIIGLPIRVGFMSEWTKDSGEVVPETLRVVFKDTAGGIFNIQARFNIKEKYWPSIAGRIAAMVNGWDGESFIKIAPRAGSREVIQNGQKLKPPTFINASQCTGPRRWEEIEIRQNGLTAQEYIEKEFAKLATLPIYEDFVREDSDGADEWDARDELTAFAKANSLAEPFAFTTEWEAALTKLTKKPFSFAEQSPDDMQKLVVKLGQAGREKILAAGLPEDYDPFADN